MNTLVEEKKDIVRRDIPMGKALILVDIQNDFCPGGSLPVPNGDEVVEIANKLLEKDFFNIVVLTQDWHPQNHVSFASNHPGNNVFGTIKLENGIEQKLWPDHCVQKTSGAMFHPSLKIELARVIRKGMNPQIDSYSGFYDNANNEGTGLYELLKTYKINDVYIMGLATDFCVKFTALHAAQELMYDTYVIEDGCRGFDSEKAFNEMKEAGAHIIKSEELLN